MKHIGIITEYNPFHNGHQYQLNTIRQQFPEKRIIVIMSGDYVQRGEPAVFNKYLRARCALQAGADIVFELPSLFASSSAEYFSSSAVLSLAATGIIDTLCFGCEDTDLDAFTKIAGLFLEEPAAYRQTLKQHLKDGFAYPKARSLAAADYFQNDAYSRLLKQPNNILGIEYMKIIQKYKLDITPFIIKRTGSGYHDISTDHTLCSASALRHTLEKENTDLRQYMPEAAWNLLEKSEYAKPLFLSDFYPSLQYALWQKDSYEDYFEVTRELSNRLCTIRSYPGCVKELISQLTSKNLTETRIQRSLLNILLNHTNADMASAKKGNYVSYLRLLGFRSSSAPLLKEMKTTCSIPVINKVAQAEKILSKEEYSVFQKDLRSSALYQQIFFNKYHVRIPSEYEHSVIIEK